MTLVALARAAHPGPCVAVTAFVAALGAAAGVGPARLGLAAAAVLAGQLSVGWANDWLDAGRDRAAGRGDKPVATGELTVAVVRGGALTAVVAAAVLTALLGWPALAAHGPAVAAGWAYDAGVKATPASPAPYAVAFALLPVFVAAVAGGVAPAWTIAAAALIGAGAHFTNAVGDLRIDRATGVVGLPQRLGAPASMLAAAALLAAGLAVATTGAAAAGAPLPTAGVVAVAATLAVAVAAGRARRGRAAFRLTLVATGALVVLVALGAADPLG